VSARGRSVWLRRPGVAHGHAPVGARHRNACARGEMKPCVRVRTRARHTARARTPKLRAMGPCRMGPGPRTPSRQTPTQNADTCPANLSPAAEATAPPKAPSPCLRPPIEGGCEKGAFATKTRPLACAPLMPRACVAGHEPDGSPRVHGRLGPQRGVTHSDTSGR